MFNYVMVSLSNHNRLFRSSTSSDWLCMFNYVMVSLSNHSSLV